MLSNLLNNAAKYTPEGGKITLIAERSGPEVVVRVHDNGIGIPAELLPGCSTCSSRLIRRCLGRAEDSGSD